MVMIDCVKINFNRPHWRVSPLIPPFHNTIYTVIAGTTLVSK